MPKDTFFNLPPDKRKRVVDVALEEFASKDYQDVYVTTIADRAGIAKGSFYQYFEDKRDLFLYLIEVVKDAKMEFIKAHTSLELSDFERGDFFKIVADMAIAGIKFGLTNPLYERLYHRVFTIPHNEPAAKAFSELMETSTREVVAAGVASGSLRDDIPIDLLSSMFLAMSRSFGSYALTRQLDGAPLPADPEGSTRNESELRQLVDHYVSLLREGFAQKGRGCT